METTHYALAPHISYVAAICRLVTARHISVAYEKLHPTHFILIVFFIVLMASWQNILCKSSLVMHSRVGRQTVITLLDVFKPCYSFAVFEYYVNFNLI